MRGEERRGRGRSTCSGRLPDCAYSHSLACTRPSAAAAAPRAVPHAAPSPRHVPPSPSPPPPSSSAPPPAAGCGAAATGGVARSISGRPSSARVAAASAVSSSSFSCSCATRTTPSSSSSSSSSSSATGVAASTDGARLGAIASDGPRLGRRTGVAAAAAAGAGAPPAFLASLASAWRARLSAIARSASCTHCREAASDAAFDASERTDVAATPSQSHRSSDADESRFRLTPPVSCRLGAPGSIVIAGEAAGAGAGARAAVAAATAAAGDPTGYLGADESGEPLGVGAPVICRRAGERTRGSISPPPPPMSMWVPPPSTWRGIAAAWASAMRWRSACDSAKLASLSRAHSESYLGGGRASKGQLRPLSLCALCSVCKCGGGDTATAGAGPCAELDDYSNAADALGSREEECHPARAEVAVAKVVALERVDLHQRGGTPL